MKFNLSKPSNWSDFQDICFDLWRELWGDFQAHQNGRIGQAQQGVDIYGKYRFDQNYTGIQCKGKNSNYGSVLTKEEIDNESEKAIEFKPQLGTFIIATTSPRDVAVQEHCRKITAQGKYHFTVDTWSWDDIEDEIQARPSLMEKYYHQIKWDEASNEITITPISASINKINAFFSRPKVLHNYNHLVKEILQNLIYELAINAFGHGNATNFSVKAEGNSLLITDDGKKFNPTDLLNGSGRGGKATLEYAKKYVDLNYNYENKNILKIIFNNQLDAAESNDEYYLTLDVQDMFGSNNVGIHTFTEFMKIPTTADKIIVDICGQINPAISTSFKIFDTLINLKNNNQKIKIYLPGNLYYKENILEKYQDNKEITIIVKD